MAELISTYEVMITEAGCAPGSGRYGVQVDILDDISPAFPYLNALLADSTYDHQNAVLIWREKGRAFALRPHEIKVVRTEGITGLAQAHELAGDAVERVNDAWRRRDSIKPRFGGKAPPPVMDIFKLLPRTGCRKECGYATCLAFAADLRLGKTGRDRCAALHKPEHAEAAQKLAALLGVGEEERA